MERIDHDTLLEALWAVLNAPGTDFGDSATTIDDDDILSQLFDDLHQDMQRIQMVGPMVTFAPEDLVPAAEPAAAMEATEGATIEG